MSSASTPESARICPLLFFGDGPSALNPLINAKIRLQIKRSAALPRRALPRVPAAVRAAGRRSGKRKDPGRRDGRFNILSKPGLGVREEKISCAPDERRRGAGFEGVTRKHGRRIKILAARKTRLHGGMVGGVQAVCSSDRRSEGRRIIPLEGSDARRPSRRRICRFARSFPDFYFLKTARSNLRAN